MSVLVTSPDTKLQQTLTEIASTIEIHPDFSASEFGGCLRIRRRSDFTITHPQYDPIELAAAIKERFRQLPESVQDNYVLVALISPELTAWEF